MPRSAFLRPGRAKSGALGKSLVACELGYLHVMRYMFVFCMSSYSSKSELEACGSFPTPSFCIQLDVGRM